MARATPKRKGAVPSRDKARGRLRVNASADAVRDDRVGRGVRFPRLDDLSVPTRWVHTVAGALLLPVCWITLAAFFTLLGDSALVRGHWRSESFWFFGIGLAVSALAFAGFYRNFLLLYVTIHEFTHALWVLILGGRVREIHLEESGGQIHVSKTNFLIALAPYFFPLLTMGLLGLRLLLGTLVDLRPAEAWFWSLLGASWGFHITYTLWMIPREQSDLIENGVFFSLVIILLMNVLVLMGILCLADPQIGVMEAFKEWVRQGVLLTGHLEDFAGRFR